MVDGPELEEQIDTTTTFDPGAPENDDVVVDEQQIEEPDVEQEPEVDPLLEREQSWAKEREEQRRIIDRLQGMVERQAAPKAEENKAADPGIADFARKFFDDETANNLAGFMEAYEAQRLGKRFVPNEKFQQYEGAMHHMGLTFAEQQAQSEFTKMGYEQADVSTALRRVQEAAQRGEVVGNTRRALASELSFMAHEKKQAAAGAQKKARARKVEQRPQTDMRGISANANGPDIPLKQDDIDQMSDREFIEYLAKNKPSGK